MAIFDTNQRIKCNCGCTTFTEHPVYMYDITADKKKKRIEVPYQKLIRCTDCGASTISNERATITE